MQASAGVSATGISAHQMLTDLLNHAFGNGLAVAAWQLPGQKTRHLIFSGHPEKIPADTELEKLSPGFVIAPFQKDSSLLFIPASAHYLFSDQGADPASPALPGTGTKTAVDTHSDATRAQNTKQPYSSAEVETSAERSAYLQLVENGIREIEKGTFEKVVPSRTKTVDLPETFDLANAFLNLCTTYPNAFVSLTSSPQTGTWLGATPEELVRVRDKTFFSTVALAGTQPYREGTDIKKVAWTQKEIEEQALVERYIISCFKKIRLREYEEHGPKTVVAGNLMHLKSEFVVNLKETGFQQLGSVMLGLLHPTSAICGMPLEPALAFLKKNEGYSRAYYSGFLGPVNIGDDIDLFVNLRCLQLTGRKAVLYAGAGVTADSVPEQEWEETELKMNTLLSVLNRR